VRRPNGLAVLPVGDEREIRDLLGERGNDGDSARLQPDHRLGLERLGKIAKVEISTDDAKTWQDAQLNDPVLPRAQTRFQMDWAWDGKPTKIVSRSTDEKGNVQPDRKSFIERNGTNALFHYHAQQTWSIDETGRVRNVLA
jgi:hypothetical protein